MIDNERAVTPENLLEEVKALFQSEHRLVTATCLTRGEFRDHIPLRQGSELTNLRMVFPKDKEIPSITGSYLAAFLSRTR